MAEKLIILFAKAPQPGLVKTRLLPTLTPASAAGLHSAFVRDMICRFRNLDGADFELHTDTESDAWTELGVARKLQIGGDLGLKMVHALTEGLRRGFKRVLLLGSDAPTLPENHARELLAATDDVTLGPAEDGGFYGIAASRVTAEMFDSVPWSRPDTMERAISPMRSRGLQVGVGPGWYDVDDPDDLRRLLHQANLPSHTADWMKRIR